MESVPSSTTLGGYPDSVDSSPRSRGGESWDEGYPSSASGGGSRLRLMCSFGGRIVPRPTDKSLCYLGGETRIVVVDRQASLNDLHNKLSRTLLGNRPFSLKYQLPNEDLDSLISVSTDEDLENMIDEYDRIVAAGSGGGGSGNGSTGGGGGLGSSRTSRIRLFLFPAKPESGSSMGSLLDDSTKSETWFVDALNSAIVGTIDGLPRGMSADSTSVNCLLGLEDDSSTHSRPQVAPVVAGGPGDQKLARPDVQSVPDSPLLDKSSSFGSTSSAPSLSNLPPIRIRPDERLPDHRMQGNIDDHFANMVLSGSNPQPDTVQQVQVQYQPQHHPVIQMTNTTSGVVSAFSPSENPNRVISDDEKSDHSVGAHRPQQQSKPAETQYSDPPSRTVYYQERVSNEPVVKRDVQITTDTTYRIPVPVSEAAQYVYPPIQQTQPPPQSQPPQQLQHLPPQQSQQLPQQQYIQTNPQYIHHGPGTFVQVPSYYPVQQQQQQAHPYEQAQVPMYYVPIRQNPAPYNLAAVSPNLMDPTSGKPAVTLAQVPVKQEVPPTSLYRTAAPAATQAPPAAYPGMGYHVMQHHQQLQHHPSQSPAAVANYGYEFADPGRAPIYYSQATGGSPPSMAPQYQAVTTVSAALSETIQGDMRQNKQS